MWRSAACLHSRSFYFSCFPHFWWRARYRLHAIIALLSRIWQVYLPIAAIAIVKLQMAITQVWILWLYRAISPGSNGMYKQGLLWIGGLQFCQSANRQEVISHWFLPLTNLDTAKSSCWRHRRAHDTSAHRADYTLARSLKPLYANVKFFNSYKVAVRSGLHLHVDAHFL